MSLVGQTQKSDLDIAPLRKQLLFGGFGHKIRANHFCAGFTPHGASVYLSYAGAFDILCRGQDGFG
jgi:hypothetical protein